MIQLIQLLILTFSLLVTRPTFASKVSVDEFISTYDPTKLYQPLAEPVVEEIKGVPVVSTGFGTLTPEVAQVTLVPTLAYYLPPGQHPVVQVAMFKKVIYYAAKALSNTVLVEQLQTFATQLYKFFCQLAETCVKTASRLFVMPGVVLAQESGLFSKFRGNPFSEAIPQKVREVYTWDKLWNPALFPSTYLQCTAFVAMVYNLNNISLHGRMNGDAREWIYNTDLFTVYRSGTAQSAPEVLDTVVWADQERNHVGIIVEKKGSKVRVLNANSDKTEYWYKYHRNLFGNYTMTDLDGRTSDEAWVPSHWLRVRE